jgi:hypothetical protein
VSHTITVLEGKHDSSFIFGGEIVIIVIVKNDKWKGRVMCEHFYHGRATETNEAETQVWC